MVKSCCCFGNILHKLERIGHGNHSAGNLFRNTCVLRISTAGPSMRSPSDQCFPALCHKGGWGIGG